MKPVQHSFMGGEISPRMNMRSETKIYREGLGTMLNFVAKPRGPATKRNGFRYLGVVG